MLMKMIRLDYMNVRRELPASVVMMAGAVIVSLGGDAKGTAVLMQGILVLLAAILILMGLNRLVGSAMFGTEGAFRLLLPVDARARTLSKALIGGLWLGLLLSVVLLLTAAGYADYDGFHAVRMRFMERTVLYLLSIGFSPLTAGISMALVPPALVLIGSSFCMGIMILQIEINSMVLKRFKGLGIWIITLFGAAIFGGLFAGLGLLLEKLVLLHLGGLWLLFAGLGLLWAFAYSLYRGCARMMDRKMNLS
mgnify:FL=1